MSVLHVLNKFQGPYRQLQRNLMYIYPYACVSIFQDHPLLISNIFERLHLSLSHFTMFPIQMYVQNHRDRYASLQLFAVNIPS